MTLQERLEETKQKTQSIVNRINQIDQERNSLVQEAFRLEGEARVLLSLIEDLTKPV